MPKGDDNTIPGVGGRMTPVDIMVVSDQEPEWDLRLPLAPLSLGTSQQPSSQRSSIYPGVPVSPRRKKDTSLKNLCPSEYVRRKEFHPDTLARKGRELAFKEALTSARRCAPTLSRVIDTTKAGLFISTLLIG